MTRLLTANGFGENAVEKDALKPDNSKEHPTESEIDRTLDGQCPRVVASRDAFAATER